MLAIVAEHMLLLLLSILIGKIAYCNIAHEIKWFKTNIQLSTITSTNGL